MKRPRGSLCLSEQIARRRREVLKYRYLKSSSHRDDFTFKHCADDQLHFPAHQLERGRRHFHRHREDVILGDPKDKQVWLKAVDKIVCSVGEAGRTVIRTGLTGISPRAAPPPPAILQNHRYYTQLLFDNIRRRVEHAPAVGIALRRREHGGTCRGGGLTLPNNPQDNAPSSGVNRTSGDVPSESRVSISLRQYHPSTERRHHFGPHCCVR